jgi:hypothetical protein
MKFSSWLAAGALVGRKIVNPKIGLIDGILATIIAKNEVVDKDGQIRKWLSGKSESELLKLKKELDNEMEPAVERPKVGFMAGFKDGLF